MINKLTPEDVDMLKYFWEEKGSIERYAAFESIKPVLQQHHPEVLKAWNDYQASIRIMDAVMKSLNVDYEE